MGTGWTQRHLVKPDDIRQASHALPLYDLLVWMTTEASRTGGKAAIRATSADLAAQLGVTAECIEKWKRRLRDCGLLQCRQRGHQTQFNLPGIEAALQEEQQLLEKRVDAEIDRIVNGMLKQARRKDEAA